MAIYIRRDLEVDDGGELQFERGDIKLATTKRSIVQALTYLILTDRGDAMVPEAAGDLGSFFGALNLPRTHRSMEHSVSRAIAEQGLMAPGDVAIRVVPVDIEVAAITARISGTFVEEDDTVDFEDVLLGYIYPFGVGQPSQVE